MSFYRGTGTPGTGTAASRPVRLDELAASDGSSLVGFIQSGAGAVATTVQAKLRETKHVNTDYGATGLGVDNDTTAIAAAIADLNTAGGGILDFDGVYNLGDDTGSGLTSKFNITSDNVMLRFSAKTKFLARNDSAITQVFVLRGISNFKIIGQLRVESDAATTYTTAGSYGAKALAIYNNASANCGNIEIESVYLTRGSLAVIAGNDTGYSKANRISGIRIGSIKTKDATYGFNAQENGDDVEIGIVDTDNAYRSYFSYGAKNHKAFVRAVNTYNAGTPINLTRYSPTTEGGGPIETVNYKLDLDVIGGTPSTLVTLRHIGDSTSSQQVANISINARSDVAPAKCLDLINYDTSGGSPTATPFNAKISNIEMRLNGGTPTSVVTINSCQWVTKPDIRWAGGSINTAVWYSLSTYIDLYANLPGAMFSLTDLNLKNNQRIAHFTNSGTVYRLAGSDASNNIHFGEARTDAMYAAIYGGTNGIYLNANGASRLQVTSTQFRPNTDNTMAVGDATNRFLSGYVVTQTVETLNVITTTVAGLPAAGTAGVGARKFVTDATATTFASVVAGGGANKVPVWSDGTNWLIG